MNLKFTNIVATKLSHWLTTYKFIIIRFKKKYLIIIKKIYDNNYKYYNKTI
jgi:hypothetical protein